MAQYLVTYDDGSEQTLNVDSIVYDGDQYIARANGETVAYIPPVGVRSIVLQDTKTVTD